MPADITSTSSLHASRMLKEVGQWMRRNGEGIYGSRAWVIPDEGQMVEGKLKTLPGGKLGKTQAEFSLGPQDFRTVGKDGALYAWCMTVPAGGTALKIMFLGSTSNLLDHPIQSLALSGGMGAHLDWKQEADDLVIQCPAAMPFASAIRFRIGFGETKS